MGPKTETPLDPQAPITLTFEQLQSLLANRVGRSKDEELELIRAQADANAEANKRALRPENTDHPGVSIFSRPGGEKANPKGEFKCRILWTGAQVDKETVTAEEFDLLNQIVPGEYACTRPDGSKFPVSVSGDRNPATGVLESMNVFFATRGQLRHGLPSMVAMCREMLAQAASPVKVA